MIRRINYIIKLFKRGNVCVSGLRGKGKDLLFGNVIVRRKEDYISNIDYTERKKYIPLDLSLLDLGGCTYDDLINGTVPYYEFPYPYGSDIYLSDAGVYMPSQYCNELNKKYPYVSNYMALSRQVSRNNFHINTQNLNRCYDKIREQSDTYLWCDKLLYIPKVDIVIQRVIEYEKYQSCVDRVKPPRVHIPISNKGAQTQARVYLDQFKNSHGDIKTHWLIYRNKSKHDTYYFEKLFKGGIKVNEKNIKKDR